MKTHIPLQFLDKCIYRFIIAFLFVGIFLAGPLQALLHPQPAQAETVLPPINTGTEPFAMAVNPVTNKVYVANQDSDNVTVIDGATNHTTTVAAGIEPYAVAVNPVTNKAYVANKGSNNVTVIDGDTSHTTTVAAGTTPWAVAVNPVTNKIYVANNDSQNVTVIDGATNLTTTVTTGT